MNWKNATGDSGRLMKHSQSDHHLIAIENEKFRRQEDSILNQLVAISEAQKKKLEIG